MEFSASSVDWGVRPWIYTLSWLAWLVAIITARYGLLLVRSKSVRRHYAGVSTLILTCSILEYPVMRCSTSGGSRLGLRFLS